MGEIIINDVVLKNMNIFTVSIIIINIIICQYILVISGRRSNLDTVKIMSNIYLMLQIEFYLIRRFVILIL